MKYETVVFDFDGTIGETRLIALGAMNALADEFGFKLVSEDELTHLAQFNARTLLLRRLGIPYWNILKIRRLEKRGREEFAKRAAHIVPVVGMKEAIEALRAAGLTVGVLSSNAETIVKSALQRGDITVDFVDAGSRFFRKAAAIRAMLRKKGFDRSSVLYIGDELRDVDACKKIGLDMIAVGWGYNHASALAQMGVAVAHSPQELVHMILSDGSEA